MILEIQKKLEKVNLIKLYNDKAQIDELLSKEKYNLKILTLILVNMSYI